MPKISVVVPTYNAEETILETVDSVLKQTLTDFELIIINDGSTDKTLETLNKVQDHRLKVETFENAGVIESRNRGIRLAQGEYISFLDSDDVWKPSKLSEQLQALENHPEAAVAYSWVDYIDVNSNFIHHGWHPEHQGDVYNEMFQYCFIENGSNILVRREAIATIGEFDPAAAHAEDWDFYLRLAEKFQFACVPQVHILYRTVPNSRSSQINKLEKAGFFVLQKAFRKSPQRLQRLRKKSLRGFYSYLFYRAFSQAKNREQWLTALKMLLKGIWHSPAILNAIAKRRIGRAFYGVIANQ